MLDTVRGPDGQAEWAADIAEDGPHEAIRQILKQAEQAGDVVFRIVIQPPIVRAWSAPEA